MAANKYAPILDPEATGPRSWPEYEAARAARAQAPAPEPAPEPKPKRAKK